MLGRSKRGAMYRVGHTIGYLTATIVLQAINALIVVAVHVAAKIIKLKHKMQGES